MGSGQGVGRAVGVPCGAGSGAGGWERSLLEIPPELGWSHARVLGFRSWQGRIWTPTLSPRCGTAVGALGGATIPGQVVWGATAPWPFPCRLKPKPLCFTTPQPCTPNPQGKGQGPASLPEKLLVVAWLWGLEMSCQGRVVWSIPCPGTAREQEGPGGMSWWTRKDVIMDQEGPGGMSSWTRRDMAAGPGGIRRDQEGHHCGTRRDQEGFYCMGPRRTREDQEGPTLVDQERHYCVGLGGTWLDY